MREFDSRAADHVEERAFGDHHFVLGIGEQVGDLFGGAGVVDRERRGAQVQCGRVDEVELGPVGEHDPDGVAATDAERGEPCRDRFDPLGVLPPGDLRGAADRT
ncbi:hypothetical protein [Nocardia xishanensis]